MICLFGCEVDRLVARGLCHKCYQRLLWRKRNNPDTWPGWPSLGERLPARGLPCDYCEEPRYARGMCRSHYRRFQRRGRLRLA